MADDAKSPSAGNSPGAIWALGIAALVLGSGIFYGFWKRGTEPKASFTINGRTPSPEAAPLVVGDATLSVPDSRPRTPDKPMPSPAAEVVVHIAGAVKSPGVYRFAPDTRVDNAVKRAGGAAPNADLNAINLAERVEEVLPSLIKRASLPGQARRA
jgi:competence protein ComEA